MMLQRSNNPCKVLCFVFQVLFLITLVHCDTGHFPILDERLENLLESQISTELVPFGNDKVMVEWIDRCVETEEENLDLEREYELTQSERRNLIVICYDKLYSQIEDQCVFLETPPELKNNRAFCSKDRCVLVPKEKFPMNNLNELDSASLIDMIGYCLKAGMNSRYVLPRFFNNNNQFKELVVKALDITDICFDTDKLWDHLEEPLDIIQGTTRSLLRTHHSTETIIESVASEYQKRNRASMEEQIFLSVLLKTGKEHMIDQLPLLEHWNREKNEMDVACPGWDQEENLISDLFSSWFPNEYCNQRKELVDRPQDMVIEDYIFDGCFINMLKNDSLTTFDGQIESSDILWTISTSYHRTTSGYLLSGIKSGFSPKSLYSKDYLLGVCQIVKQYQSYDSFSGSSTKPLDISLVPFVINQIDNSHYQSELPRIRHDNDDVTLVWSSPIFLS